jgi:DNA-binding transcriptional LysR family regulator
MNIEHYRNFIKIAELGTISGAARELLIAQPALSNQLKAFEKEYGVQLLKRGAKHVELTDAGQILYEKAKIICSLEEMARHEIKTCASGERGILRLGVTPSYPDHFVENILLVFHARYPYITFDIFETSSDQIMDLLQNRIIEVGIIRTPVYINPAFTAYNAVEERLMALFHKASPWLSPDLAEVPVTYLRGVPLSISRGFQEKVHELCRAAGFVPAVLNVCSSRVTNVLWARHNQAVALITTSCASKLETRVLRCRPLAGGDVLARRSFAILKGRPLSPEAQSFLNFATAGRFSPEDGGKKGDVLV